ncbi:MAG TPA: DUF4105 domain-containing protein, partial [Kofleriaceae bacterium]|nr:DUF4105 domain-containing protein [Kofleriaceae bacterium]
AGAAGPARAAEPGEEAPGVGAAPTAPQAPAAPPPAPAGPLIELYTMGQGEHMFEKFGHAALCVAPAGRGRTRCYNYGTTDFDSVVPLFWGFLRGRSVFWVSESSRARMLAHYRDADRTIWRQVLPIEPDAARQVAEELARVVRGDERFYQYHHFHDNCSTRLRDILDRATGGALSADRDAGPARPTYREISRAGFAGQTALLLASDLILGRRADRAPDAYQAMFLPDVLRAEVEARLGAAPELVYQRRGPPFPDDPGLGGRWVWLAFAALVAAPVAIARWRGRRERMALALAAAPLALLGLILWALAIVSPLPEVRWNEALLVFVPSDIALPLLAEAARRRYAAARAALLGVVSLLLAAGALVQPLWLLIPIPLGVMLLALLPRR